MRGSVYKLVRQQNNPNWRLIFVAQVNKRARR